MLFTIGHSNRTLLQFISIAKAHNIELIADVRATPAMSRAFPHFNAANLKTSIPEAGIEYMHFPDLGGRRGKCDCINPKLNAEWRVPQFKNYADYAYTSDKFRQDLEAIIELGKTKRVAYMCSEAVPWRCHRSIMTDYYLMIYKEEIIHLLGEKQTMKATPHDFASVSGNKVIFSKVVVKEIFE